MNTHDEKFVAYWAPKSKMGRLRYSFYHGTCFFGGMMLAGNLLIGHFLFDNPVTWERLLVGIPIWAVAGFFAFGWVPWPANEKRYQKLINQG
jgi:hypothetical protein